ncbi:Hypothetical protein CINCED_3A022153 [Cinara cedri]|uniref:Uncharacterized protein n=1 Tax=Cinara cedri TaxID=506608 RepID=A0A5E4MXW6_9HEMI|nr:Hypothetical protein CINCED_3A022153 [Cinara cedri]
MDNEDLSKEIEFSESCMNTKKNYDRAAKVEEARCQNLLYNCENCLKTDFLCAEVCCCPKAHSFCLICIKKLVEKKVRLRKLEFKCMADCPEDLNFDMLLVSFFYHLCFIYI